MADDIGLAVGIDQVICTVTWISRLDLEKARQVVEKLRAMRLAKAAEIVEAGIDEIAFSIAAASFTLPVGTGVHTLR